MMVNLSAADIILAAHRAGIIDGVKQVQLKAGEVRNRRVASMNDFSMNYIGLLGEIAVCRVLGCQIRMDVTRYGDGAIDLIHHGQTIQVKTSTHASLKQRRMVFLRSMDDFACDWLIACSIQSPSSIALHGFISRRKFQARSFEHDFGYGPNVAVWEDDLSPIERFEEATGMIKEAA